MAAAPATPVIFRKSLLETLLLLSIIIIIVVQNYNFKGNLTKEFVAFLCRRRHMPTMLRKRRIYDMTKNCFVKFVKLSCR